MKKLRNTIILGIGFALCTVMCFFAAGMLKPQDTNGVFAAEQTTITAKAKIGTTEVTQGSTVKIGDNSLSLGGTAYVTVGSSPNITVTPETHYELLGIVVKNADTNEVIDLYGEDNSATPLDPVVFSFTPVSGIAYLLEIELEERDYSISVTAKFHDGSPIEGTILAGPVNNITEVTTAAADSSVSVTNSAITMENKLVNNNGDRYPDIRFAYAELVHPTQPAQTRIIGISDLFSYTVPLADLEAFLDGTVLKINAVYTQTYLVKVEKSAAEASDGTVETEVTNPLWNQLILQGFELQPRITYQGPFEEYLDKGSVIEVYPGDDDAFKYDREEPTTITEGEAGYLDNLQGALTICVNYIADEYEIVIQGRVAGVNIDVAAASSTVVTRPDGEESIALIGNVLSKVVFDSTAHPEYTFDGFSLYRLPDGEESIYEPITDVTESEGIYTGTIDKTIDATEFLYSYVVDGKITVFVNLIQNYKVNIYSLPLTEANAGLYTAYEYDLVNKERTSEAFSNISDKYFPAGTVLEIIARDSTYSLFKNYESSSVNLGTELELDENSYFIEITTLTGNPTLNLIYEPRPFTLTTQADKATFDKNAYNYNDTVVITYTDVPSGHNIKTWTVNGIDLTGSVRGNTLSIKVTDLLEEYPTLLKDGLITINYNVETVMKTELMLAIILPSVAIPVLAIVLLILFLINAKRKRLIRAELSANRQERMKKDIGGVISELREGGFKEISDEDVKKAMKEQKEKKKTEGKK